MNRTLATLAFAVALAWAPEAEAQIGLLFAFEGFGYEAHDFDPGNYLALGEGYEMVGVVTSVGSWVAPGVDMATHQYTLHLSGLTVVERQIILVPEQVLFVRFADNARVLFYEDPIVGGTPASYGVDPPNATSPSTFTDGQLVLGGEVDQFQLYYDFSQGYGGFQSNRVDYLTGRLLESGYVPFQSSWWLHGYLNEPPGTPPAGYRDPFAGVSDIPIDPVQRSTWGAIKRTYR